MTEPISFSYQAQTLGGQALAGSLAATDIEAARATLTSLNLRIINLAAEPNAPRQGRAKPLRGEDFQAFNEQLAHLTAAGLPVEQGLRLIAQDMRSGRLAQSVREVADELSRGVPLEEAFGRHQNRFPPLYARLLTAGIKANNLPGVLFNLGKHMELLARVRSALWRAAAYPMMVCLGLVLVVLFLSIKVLPEFRNIFLDFRTRLPWATELLLLLGDYWYIVAIMVVAMVLLVSLTWLWVRVTGYQNRLVDRLLLPLPILGQALRASLLVRWCNALRLGV
ncbi:MAG: type II secretion system F family protein, partial [Phycisphaerae bacterium]